MKADDIVNFIVKETAPKYNGLQDKEKKLFHAILQSVPSDILPEVIEKLERDKSVPWELWGFINWMRMDHHSKKERPNEPITLLRWYEDKKSKKVSYSYERLSKRFDGQSHSDQKRILRAFLEGGNNHQNGLLPVCVIAGSRDWRKRLKPLGQNTKDPQWPEPSFI